MKIAVSVLAKSFTWLIMIGPLQAQTTLISSGSTWKFLDNGSNQGTSWSSAGFNDATWSSGNAQFGYGDGDETTIVGYGSNSSAKFITTYFRKSITIADASLYSSFTLNVKRDDGVVVYINGTERYRNNMPTGTISYSTLASTAASDDGANFISSTLATGTLVTGTNVIAIEVHQNTASSSDLSFDLSLIGNTSSSSGGATLTRGPYLQSGAPTSLILRWKSSVATNSMVKYGLSPDNLSLMATDAASVTDHTVKLSGLTPDTKYYYSIGSSSQTLQGDANNFFVTAPVKGTEKKTRIWVTGDCGNNSTNQINVRNKYAEYMGTNYTDLWLLLGDNAYSYGYDSEYQTNFFNIYKDDMLKKTVLWPAPGNHDYAKSSSRQNDHKIPYYDIFSLPKNGEAGGVASGTEAFYSYDYANIHFISLDSYGKESNAYRLYDTLGPQVTWLKKDLAANTQKWTVVYWHHPPYTMGSHNSDTSTDLILIRQNLLRILERYKVDLVLCGHSHLYERTKLIKGHYGAESTYNESVHAVSNSSAKYNGTTSSCPYEKNVSNSYKGTVYVVSGSAGKLGTTQTSYPHAAMYTSNYSVGGSLAIDVDANRLDAKWVCSDGAIRDQFTIMKDVSKTTNVTISEGQSATLTASWVGNYSWNPNGATSRSITVSPTENTTYSVNDGVNCISDAFNVTVVPAPSALSQQSQGMTEANLHAEELALNIYPNPVPQRTTIEYSTPFVGDVRLEIYDLKGQKVKSLVNSTQDNGTYKYELITAAEELKAGIYIVSLSFGEHQITQKISVLE